MQPWHDKSPLTAAMLVRYSNELRDFGSEVLKFLQKASHDPKLRDNPLPAKKDVPTSRGCQKVSSFFSSLLTGQKCRVASLATRVCSQ